MRKCDYGCGQEAKYQLKNGKWCCSKSQNSCPKIRRKLSDGNKGKRKGNQHAFGKHWKLSKETKKKISKANTGRPKNKEHKRKISESLKKWWKEIGWSKETRNKVSQRMKGNKYGLGKTWKLSGKTKQKMSDYWQGRPRHWQKGKNNPMWGVHRYGENNPNWNGGISKLPYAPDWGPKVKRKVLKRDNHECQNCGEIENFSVHHINYDKMNCDSTNLITLCVSCNGRANSNRNKWQKLYEEKNKKWQ